MQKYILKNTQFLLQTIYNQKIMKFFLSTLTLCSLWLACTLNCIAQPYYYNPDIVTLFENNSCIGCHGGSGGFDISYQGLFDATNGNPECSPKVIAGNADASPLVSKIDPNIANCKGSNMPKGMPALSSEDIQMVKDWINAGAPENAPLQPACDLVITGYVEGSSFNKCLEIYNPTGADVNLSEYVVAIFFNGKDTADNPIGLEGVLPADSYFVICHPNANLPGLTPADQTDNFLNFNGNDAITLLHNDIIIDAIGQVGTDPGDSWLGIEGCNSKNATLVKNMNPEGSECPYPYFDGSTEFSFDNYVCHPIDDVTGLASFQALDCPILAYKGDTSAVLCSGSSVVFHAKLLGGINQDDITWSNGETGANATFIFDNTNFICEPTVQTVTATFAPNDLCQAQTLTYNITWLPEPNNTNTTILFDNGGDFCSALLVNYCIANNPTSQYSVNGGEFMSGEQVNFLASGDVVLFETTFNYPEHNLACSNMSEAIAQNCGIVIVECPYKFVNDEGTTETQFYNVCSGQELTLSTFTYLIPTDSLTQSSAVMWSTGDMGANVTLSFENTSGCEPIIHLITATLPSQGDECGEQVLQFEITVYPNTTNNATVVNNSENCSLTVVGYCPDFQSVSYFIDDMGFLLDTYTGSNGNQITFMVNNLVGCSETQSLTATLQCGNDTIPTCPYSILSDEGNTIQEVTLCSGATLALTANVFLNEVLTDSENVIWSTEETGKTINVSFENNTCEAMFHTVTATLPAQNNTCTNQTIVFNITVYPNTTNNAIVVNDSENCSLTVLQYCPEFQIVSYFIDDMGFVSDTYTGSNGNQVTFIVENTVGCGEIQNITATLQCGNDTIPECPTLTTNNNLATKICSGNELMLQVNVSDATQAANIQWSNGQTGSMLMTQALIAQDCESNFETFTATLPATADCPEQSIDFEVEIQPSVYTAQQAGNLIVTECSATLENYCPNFSVETLLNNNEVLFTNTYTAQPNQNSTIQFFLVNENEACGYQSKAFDAIALNCPPLITTGSVSSLVWEDNNQNGEKENNELALAGVTVTLYTEDGTAIASTTTNQSGQYTFQNIPYGTYYLTFEIAGRIIVSGAADETGTTNIFDLNDQANNVMVMVGYSQDICQNNDLNLIFALNENCDNETYQISVYATGGTANSGAYSLTDQTLTIQQNISPNTWTNIGEYNTNQAFNLQLFDDNNCKKNLFVKANCTQNPLQANLLYFRGNAQNNANVLNWATASEVQNHYFTISSSTNGTNFEKVGTVTGAGTTNQTQTYQLTDHNAPQQYNTVFYQLAQTDFDGKTTILSTITINKNNTAANIYDITNIVPMPVQNTATIYYTSTQTTQANLQIFDITGKMVYTQTLNTLQGNNATTLTTTQFTAGMYLVKITNGNTFVTTKMIKQ